MSRLVLLLRSRTHRFEALYQFIISVATCVQEISVNPRSAFACSSIMFATKPRPRNTEKRSTLTTPYVSYCCSHIETQLRSFHRGEAFARQPSKTLYFLQFSGFSLSHGLTIRNSGQHGWETRFVRQVKLTSVSSELLKAILRRGSRSDRSVMLLGSWSSQFLPGRLAFASRT